MDYQKFYERVKQQSDRTYHVEMDFRCLDYQGNGLFSTGGENRTIFLLSKDGARYINDKIREVANRSTLFQIFKRDKERYAKLVTEARQLQLANGQNRMSRTEKFIGAFIGDTLEGMLKNYDVFKNAEVLDMLKGLEHRTYKASLSRREMNIYLHSRGQFGVVIRNGETGYATLGFFGYLGMSVLEYRYPLLIERKHLKNLNQAKDALHEILSAARELELSRKLQNMLFKDALNILKMEFGLDDKFHEIDFGKGKDAFDVLIALDEKSKTRGWKVYCQKLYNYLCDQANNGT